MMWALHGSDAAAAAFVGEGLEFLPDGAVDANHDDAITRTVAVSFEKLPECGRTVDERVEASRLIEFAAGLNVFRDDGGVPRAAGRVNSSGRK